MRVFAFAALLLSLSGTAMAQEQPIEPVGVPECDSLIARWNACRMRKPVNERLPMDTTIRQQRAGWAQLAPNRRAMVAGSCTQASQMLLDGCD